MAAWATDRVRNDEVLAAAVVVAAVVVEMEMVVAKVQCGLSPSCGNAFALAKISPRARVLATCSLTVSVCLRKHHLRTAGFFYSARIREGAILSIATSVGRSGISRDSIRSETPQKRRGRRSQTMQNTLLPGLVFRQVLLILAFRLFNLFIPERRILTPRTSGRHRLLK